jgi:hypothetical protein
MQRSIGQQSKKVVRDVSPWIEGLARLGFVAKGVVYTIIGVLAVSYAFGSGGETGGTKNAFQTIAEQPFGSVLLGIVAAGLIGYGLWLFINAGLDLENDGSEMKGMVKRVGRVINGLIHLGLAFIAGRMALGFGAGSSESQSAVSWTAWLMGLPFGTWLVGLVGLTIIGVGLYRLYEGYSVHFRDELELNRMDQTEEKWTIRAGRVGLIAQGLVLAMIGSFLIQAAVQYQPSEARGVGGALQTLAQQPYGPWLLAIVALGLVAHGIYMFILSKYRRIETA